MALPFAMVRTQLTCHHYAHAMKTSLWHMPSAVRREDTPTRNKIVFRFFECYDCHDVEIKPHLQQLQGETFALKTTIDYSRLDIKANGLWEFSFNKSHFDVKHFKPLAKICAESNIEAYDYHKFIKKNKNEELRMLRRQHFVQLSLQVPVELAYQLHRDKNILRTKISFALLCIRGSRTLRPRKIVDASMGAVVKQGRLLV